MKTFRVTPRKRKYWVETTESDEGERRIVRAFTSEDAALRYIRDMQKFADRAGLAKTTLTGGPSEGR
jgi:hypothetical protein